MKITSFCSLLLLLLSCKQQKEHQVISIKDTVLKEYVLTSENDPYFETDMSMDVLKAYYKNDTAILQNFHRSYLKYIQEKKAGHFDSCLHQPDLKDLDVDVAYRFQYWKAFCPELLNITVSNKKDSIQLHVINFHARYDLPDCRIIKEYDKKLTLKEWEKITAAIKHSDFWSLKRSNEVWGYDGDGLTVTGFISTNSFNSRPKLHIVSRWSAGSTDIATPFLITLKLSGYKGCLSPE